MTTQLPTDVASRQKRLVVIDGDATHVYNLQTEKTVSTLDFFSKIHTESRVVKTPILPFGCIRYASTKTTQQYVLSFPPTFISATFLDGKEIYNVGLPFSVIIINARNQSIIDSVALYLSKGPIVSEDTEVFMTALPNQYDSQLCCMGNGFNSIATGKTPILQRVSQVFPYIQNSSFNEDLPVPTAYIPKEVLPEALAAHPKVDELPAYIKGVVRRPRDFGPNRVALACRAAWTILNPSPDAALKLGYVSAGKLSRLIQQ